MKWVYILKCKDNIYYVGQTKRLYRRFWEHQNGEGGLNTSIFQSEEIVAIYKVDTICKFIDYNNYINKIIDGILGEDYMGLKLKDFNNECEVYNDDCLDAETNIVECLMIHNKDKWNNFRGGKYTRFDIDYKYPNNNYIKGLPLCKCGLPCDIRKNDDKEYLFFRCAKKNMWDKLKNEFDVDDSPCNFFMEYTKDKQLKLEEKNKFEERKNILKKLFKKSYWLKNINNYEEDENGGQCVGGCGSSRKTKMISNYGEKICLCYDCFIDKNNELSKKYINNGKCLIKLE